VLGETEKNDLEAEPEARAEVEAKAGAGAGAGAGAEVEAGQATFQAIRAEIQTVNSKKTSFIRKIIQVVKCSRVHKRTVVLTCRLASKDLRIGQAGCMWVVS